MSRLHDVARSVRPYFVPGLIAFVCVLPAPAQERAPGDLLGVWRRNAREAAFVRFEAAKVSFYSNGVLDLCRASYGGGRVFAHVWGKKAEYSATVKDGILRLDKDGQKETYSKVDMVPDELIARPLAFGQDDADETRVKEIKEELSKRAKLDQAVRTDPKRERDMERVDRENTEWLIAVVKKHGWVDATRFGADAASRAFLLVQHSGHLGLMMAALPKIEEDVKHKRVSAQDFALLFDRLSVRLGEKQRFGSQIGRNNEGEMVVLALEDRVKVDALRKELGLSPLADYLKLFKAQNGGKEPAIED